MKNKVLFIVELDDMKKVLELTPVTLLKKLTACYTGNNIEELTVFSNILLKSKEPESVDISNYRLMFATKVDRVNRDNRHLVKVHIY